MDFPHSHRFNREIVTLSTYHLLIKMGISQKQVNQLVEGVTSLAGMGDTGSETVTDTASHAGQIRAFVMLQDTEFTSLTGTHAGWAGIVYPRGHVLQGRFNQFQLSSGMVDVYYK